MCVCVCNSDSLFAAPVHEHHVMAMQTWTPPGWAVCVYCMTLTLTRCLQPTVCVCVLYDSDSLFAAPAHEHHVMAMHRHGHHLGGLPVLFWGSLGTLIVIFHLFLFKMVYNEYCAGGQDHYGRTRYSL